MSDVDVSVELRAFYEARDCIEKGRWMDCTYEWRSVRKTAIIDGSQPPEKERIKAVLIGEHLGL
jgi:hypothetical protein